MKIRLSGNYTDRLLICILPWTIIAAVVLSCSGIGLKSFMLIGLISTVLFWLTDILVVLIKFRDPKTLSHHLALWYGDQVIDTDSIARITPLADHHNYWPCRMIEIALNNGQKFLILDRPETLLEHMNNKPSKTIQRLLILYPDLASRIVIGENRRM